MQAQQCVCQNMLILMKYSMNLILIISLLFTNSCDRNPEKGSKQMIIKNPFMGIETTDEPQLLAPDLLASSVEEYNGTFSSDGKEFYYTVDIPGNAFIACTKLMKNNTWSKPKVASFSGKYPDYDPIFSPDGSKLFFSSSRSQSGNPENKIWYVEKINDKWSEPKSINLIGAGNRAFYNSVTNDGVIYFNMIGSSKIFKAKKIDTAYIVEELPDIVNGDFKNYDPFISPNEDYLIFSSYREEGYGNADLYISFYINDSWTKPENLGEPINSGYYDKCPSLTPDRNFLIFASNRLSEEFEISQLVSVQNVNMKYQSYDNGKSNIYYISAGFINKLREKHVKP